MTEHDIALAKQAGLIGCIDEKHLGALTKFAELIRAEKPQGEAVYQSRIVGETKKGEWSDYCKEDYDKLLTVPHIAECRILYTTPPDQSAEIARLREALSNVIADLDLRSDDGVLNISHGVYVNAKQALENT
jgi:hypothetical protein